MSFRCGARNLITPGIIEVQDFPPFEQAVILKKRISFGKIFIDDQSL
jgi:hypothetical protein